MYLNRILFNKIKDLKKSILLLGPRQTGKTTLIKALQPDLEINLADEQVFIEYLRDPGRLKSSITSKNTIFIDEVQRLPSLLNTVQTLIDANRSLQFYLTGSSARKLKRGKANLLPGRIVTYELGPLTHQELTKNFDLQRALLLGLLPGIYEEKSTELAQKVLRTYAHVYLREEIQAEALTRNLEGFSRFFQIIASRAGDFIDFSKFSSQAMIERTTARRYFDILTDTLVIHPIEPFSRSTKRRLIQHPRYYFFDVGVLNGCQENFVISSHRLGTLFEHLFLQLVISSAKAHDDSLRISVYRTEAHAEVDFIIEKNDEIFAFEIKATRNIGSHDLRGLKSFAHYVNKPHHSTVVYLGETQLIMDGISVCPLIPALQTLGY